MASAPALSIITAQSGLSRYLEEIQRFPLLEPQEEFKQLDPSSVSDGRVTG